MGRRVGELAAASGLTVRTLHYYEEIGLLRASERTDAGHRVYTATDVQRLYRIRLLRGLGLSLAQIAQALDDPAWDLRHALSRHREDVEQRLDAQVRLRNRLGHLLASDLTGDGAFDTELLTTLEEMTMLASDVQQTITYLAYEDLEAAFEHLQDIFGLGPGRIDRDGDGRAVHAELQAGSAVIWLHRELESGDLVSPRRHGSSTAGVAVIVEDVDAHHARAVERGATIDYPPTDQPYGYREYGARDLEGGLWSFMRPLD